MSTSNMMSQMSDSLMPFGRLRLKDPAESHHFSASQSHKKNGQQTCRICADTAAFVRRAHHPSLDAVRLAKLSCNSSGRSRENARQIQPFRELCGETRITDLPEWKNVWISYVLAKAQLVEEIGARYASPSQLSSAKAAPEKIGPFDLILVASADYPPMLSLARKFADGGILIDLALDACTTEFWTATPKPCLLVKHQVRYETEGDNPAHAERAVRDLALAEALYPGWLAGQLAHSTGDSAVALLNPYWRFEDCA